jgi:hypothetical protein
MKLSESSDAEIEAAAAMMERMFAPPELPLDAERRAKYRDNARAVLTAAAAVRWQPIESAPQDETEILVHMFGNTQAVVFFDSVDKDGFVWKTADGIGYQQDAPTHWMPLPAPPTDRKEVMPSASSDMGSVSQRGQGREHDTPPREPPGGGRFAGHTPGPWFVDPKFPDCIFVQREGSRGVIGHTLLKLERFDETWTATARLIAAAPDLAARVEESERSFEIRWAADQRAIKRWQGNNPDRQLTWPDHADLVVWLAGQMTDLAAENERLRKLLGKLLPDYLAWRDAGVGMITLSVHVDDLREARAALAQRDEVKP